MAGINDLLPNGKGVWVPIDHGVSDYPVEGLTDIDGIIANLSSADAIIAHKGIVTRYSSKFSRFIAHLSASTRHGGDENSLKVCVGTVEESIKRGAKGVSVQVNMGSYGEGDMIETLGEITTDAFEQGIPVLGMIYPRGENLDIMENDDTEAIAHAVRLGFELGCDVVKTKYTGSMESFRKVVSAAPIPVLVAGGPAGKTNEEILTMVHEAMQAGAAGVCMGRQIFANQNPSAMVDALRLLVHDGLDVQTAMMKSGL